MRSKWLVVIAAFFGFVFVTVPALAHHSFTAEFDGDKLIAVKGVLTRVDWQNPHVWYYVDVKDENGNVSNWGFENTSTTFIRRQYPDARKTFESNIGKTVAVVACPAKAVPHRAASEAIRFEDGTILKVPGGGGGYQGSEDEDKLLQGIK